MSMATLAKHIVPVTALAAVAATGILASSAAGGKAASTANIRPICNGIFFNMPPGVGQSVTIPVHTVAADPDVTPVQLVAVANYGDPIGTAQISGNDLVFTLTSSTPGTVYLYWTISDGELTAQCTSTGSNEEAPDNG
jgi:hypothetical protein